MPSSEKRALEVVVGKLAILSLPILLLLFGIEAGLRRMPTLALGKRTIADARAAQTDVLVLGSSQALHGISPKLISPNATSLASSSQDLYYDSALVDAYINRMPRLKVIVISLSYFSFRYRLSNSPEHWRSFFYRAYFGIPEETPLPLPSRWVPRNCLFLLHYGLPDSFRFLKRGFQNDPGLDQVGWFPIPVSTRSISSAASRINDDAGFKRARLHDGIARVEFVKPNRVVLEQMLAVLRARCVSVVIAMTPVFSTYYRHLEPGTSRETIVIAKALAAQYGARFRDYQNDSRFTLEDFSDNDHLNAHGAEKFTTILAHELIKPVLLTKVPPDPCDSRVQPAGLTDGPMTH